MKEPHFSMVKDLLSKAFTVKAEAAMIFSFAATGLTSFIQWTLDTTFLGVTIFLVLITFFLILVDFVVGVNAAGKVPGDQKVQHKIAYTMLKCVMFFLWLFIAFSVKHEYKSIPWFDYVISAITTFPVFLVNLREFISIGDNIEIIFKKKPYIFTLVDKAFDSLERLFISRISVDPTQQPTPPDQPIEHVEGLDENDNTKI